MHDFMEELVVSPVRTPLWQQLKQRSYPLLIWGAGTIARVVCRYLREKDISPAGVFVDNLYYEEGKIFEGFPVLSLSDIVEAYPQCDIVMGHADYCRATEIGQLPNVKKVFYLTSMAYHHYDPLSLGVVRQHHEAYQFLYEHLCDDLSRHCFSAFLSARICDDASYVWPYAPPRRLSYFQTDILPLSENETYLDIGSYTGDTIRDFIRAVDGKYRKIIGFEANTDNYRQLERHVKSNGFPDISLLPLGTWDTSGVLFMDNEEEENSLHPTSVENGEPTNVIALDEYFAQHDPGQHITIAKINFLTGVLETLNGGRGLLTRDRPSLVITVGFDDYALLTVPQWILSNLPSYHAYLRFCQAMPARLVYYGIPSERDMLSASDEYVGHRSVL